MARCVVIGGAGAVGSLFVGRLAGDGDEVCVVDRQPANGSGASPAVRHLVADAEKPDAGLADELSQADLVLLAVPEDVALAALPGVVRHLRPEALLVDVLSVKTRIAAAEQAEAPGRPTVSLNPMFAPSLDLKGRPIAAVIVCDGPPVQPFLDRLSAWGGQLVLMTADHHDRVTAATQTLTHAAVLAAGLALAELDVDIDELAALGPPPHQTLLALVARIVSGPSEPYWDVQAGNPYAVQARAAMQTGLQILNTIVEDGAPEPFDQLTVRLQRLLGDHLDEYGDLCARAFASTTGPPPHPHGREAP